MPSDKLGIQMKKPRYPQYAVFSKRLESFKNWPTHLGIKPDVLAEAGLVYTGIGDAVRCYHCGGGLRDWEQGDNPWREHAKWYSECPHVVLLKGQPFIDRVLNGDSIEDGTLQSNEPNKETDAMESPAALSCVAMGYDTTLVQRAIKKYMDEKDNSYLKGTEIAQLCEELRDNDISEKVSSNTVAENVQPSTARSEFEAGSAENESCSLNTAAGSVQPSFERSEFESRSAENESDFSNYVADSGQPSVGRSESEASSTENESVSSSNVADNFQSSFERSESEDSRAENAAFGILGFNEDLLNHQYRLNTFVNWPGRADCNTWELAYSGFYFHGTSRNSDLLRCVFCGILVRDWMTGDSPWFIHARHSPECINLLVKRGLEYLYTVYNANHRLLTLQRARELPLVYSVSRGIMCDGLYGLIERGLMLTHTPNMYLLNDGTSYYPPRHPAFISYYDRLQSFQGYSGFGEVFGIQELANSGQVYHGVGLLTYCYYCGEQFLWNNGVAEPWEKHARKKQNCFHVIFSKGECFLKKALSGVQETNDICAKLSGMCSHLPAHPEDVEVNAVVPVDHCFSSNSPSLVWAQQS